MDTCVDNICFRSVYILCTKQLYLSLTLPFEFEFAHYVIVY